MSHWTQIHINTSKKHADALGEELTSLGALAITFQDAGDDPIYEPSLNATPLWDKTRLTALFENTTQLDAVLAHLKYCQSQHILEDFQTESLPDEDWIARGIENFKPICFGKRLWICPSWQTPPNPHAVNVILDPGLAFGTGTHPTTALCLKWLDANINSQSLVIDYGCGSGILALAALKLGAKKVIAVDHDPQALWATRRNAEANSLTETQLVTAMPNEVFDLEADILLANILANPLKELVFTFSQLIKSKGKILLSGILEEQTEDILNTYNSLFNMEKPVIEDGWACIAGSGK